MSTLGKTSIGAVWGVQGDGYTNQNIVLAPSDVGSVSKLTAYVRNLGASAEVMRAVIITALATGPRAGIDTVVAVSDEVTLAPGTAAGWKDFVFSTAPPTLTPGDYYAIGVWAGPTNAMAEVAYDTTAGITTYWMFSSYSLAPTFVSPYPSSGGGSTANEAWSFYLTYTPVVLTPVNTVSPSIAGMGAEGQTLTSATGSWDNTPTSYTYQWQRDSNYDGVFADIAGATASTHVVVAADSGCNVRLNVTAVNGSGSTTAASNAIAIMPTPPTADSATLGAVLGATAAPTNVVPPTIAGLPQIGQVLVGSDGVWSGDTSRTHKWQSDAGGSWADIPAATGSTYTVQQSDLGYDLRFVVTATNTAGNTTLNSAQVGPIIDPALIEPPGVLVESLYGTSFADAVYEEMTPVVQGDGALGYPFRTYIRAQGVMFQLADYLGRDSDTGIAWSKLVDVDYIPAPFLPWLGQWVGADVDASRSEQQQRDQVKGEDSWQRGAAVALENAAQPFLTGDKQVVFKERDGDPYFLTVITRTAETPDPAAVLNALMLKKPAGIILTYLVADGNTYLEVRATYATYTALRSAFATYADLRGF